MAAQSTKRRQLLSQQPATPERQLNEPKFQQDPVAADAHGRTAVESLSHGPDTAQPRMAVKVRTDITSSLSILSSAPATAPYRTHACLPRHTRLASTNHRWFQFARHRSCGHVCDKTTFTRTRRCRCGCPQAKDGSAASTFRRRLEGATGSAQGLLAEVFWGIGSLNIPAGAVPDLTTVVTSLDFAEVTASGGIMAVATQTNNFAMRITGA